MVLNRSVISLTIIFRHCYQVGLPKLDVSGVVVWPIQMQPTGKALSLANNWIHLKATQNVWCCRRGLPSILAHKCFDLDQPIPKIFVVQQPCLSPRALAGYSRGLRIGSSRWCEGLERLKKLFKTPTLWTYRLGWCYCCGRRWSVSKRDLRQTIANREQNSQRLEALGFNRIGIGGLTSCFRYAPRPKNAPSKSTLPLKDQGILVRYFGNKPRIGNYLASPSAQTKNGRIDDRIGKPCKIK